MTNISQHIEFLLRRHDCVILPTIGAFIASYKAAHINNEWGIITPPKREIYFNASINNNDGLLANSIARKNRISFEAANRLLLQEIEKIRTHLEHEKEYSVGKLGIIHYGKEANLDFEPFKSDVQYNSHYGLLQFKMKTLAEIDNENSPSVSQQATVVTRRSDKNYYIPVNKQFARYAAMFIVVFFAAISLSVPLGQNQNQEFASIVPIKKTIIQPTEELQKTVVEDTIAPQPVEMEMAEKVVETVAPECYAVVATVRSIEEAEKFIRQADTEKELRIITVGKMSRVYTDCGKRDEMAKIISNPEFQQEFPGAWIWQPKK